MMLLLEITFKDALPYILGPGGGLVVALLWIRFYPQDKAKTKKVQAETEISLFREAMNYAEQLKKRGQEAEQQVDKLLQELEGEREEYNRRIEHEKAEYDRKVHALEERMQEERRRCQEIQAGLERKIDELKREITKREQHRHGPPTPPL